MDLGAFIILVAAPMCLEYKTKKN